MKVLKIIRKFNDAVKENWDLMPIILLAIAFFDSISSNARLIIGGTFFIFLGLINYFKLGSFSKTNDSDNYYMSRLLISLGIITFLFRFLFPVSIEIFLLTFILLVISEILLFYFKGPESFLKYVLYGAFIIPVIGLLYGLFNGVYAALSIPNINIITFVVIFLGLVGAVVFALLFYWPLEIYKNHTDKNIKKHITKINFSTFIIALISSIIFIIYSWEPGSSAMNKILLIIATINIVQVFLFSLVRGSIYLFSKRK